MYLMIFNCVTTLFKINGVWFNEGISESLVLTVAKGGAGDGGGQFASEQAKKLLNNTEQTLYRNGVICVIFL